MQRDGLALSIEIGDRTFEGRLPLLPYRFLVFSAMDELTDAATVYSPIPDADLPELLELEDVAELERLRSSGELALRLEDVHGVRVEGDQVLGASFEPDLLDVDAVGAVNVAALLLVWADVETPLELDAHVVANGTPKLESFVLPGHASRLLRAVGRDLVALGELGFEAFERLGIVDNRALYRAGRIVRQEIIASIPSPAEVEEASGNSEARAETSTGSTSSRV